MMIKNPANIKLRVDKVFGSEPIEFKLNSGLTTFVGTNASGKTQTLKSLKLYLQKCVEPNQVRYLSSNRIGAMELHRSNISNYGRNSEQTYSPGGESAKKHRYTDETASGDLFVLEDRKDVRIKVSERLSEFFNRQIHLRWDSGHLKVFLEQKGTETEYSVAAEASGLINLISILTALYDDNIRFLLIDEPEVSLHPQLQAYLLREIKLVTNQTDKLVVMSTHSAGMIDLRTVQDLSNFVFFSEGQRPKQISKDAPELRNTKLQVFLLHMTSTLNEGLFAKKILLIEGVTDLLLCRYLVNRLELNTDIAGTQIIPVQGKTHFPIITKLFSLVGKEVCLLTDLDGFVDNNEVVNLFLSSQESKSIANDLGSKDLQGLIKSLKSEIHGLIESGKERLEFFYNQHSYLINRNDSDDLNQTITRALIGVLLSSDENDLLKWPNSEEWMGIKRRMLTILGALENLGCFVLRKGSIEDYYFNCEVNMSRKTNSGMKEIAYMEDCSEEQIRHQYEDIIKALNYAARNKSIDECYAVKTELLSELALVLEARKKAETKMELVSSVKYVTGKEVSLFDYELIDEKNRKGVEVSLNSKILNVKGFPFKVYVGDNVNAVVDQNIFHKL